MIVYDHNIRICCKLELVNPCMTRHDSRRSVINILEARKAGFFARDKLLPNVIAGVLVNAIEAQVFLRSREF